MTISLEARKVVLEYSLNIEEEINNIILVFLGIDKENSKGFSNKSSSFSFKNKIDLLLDIEIINKEEFLKFETLMIIRNQFIHNINCNTFIDCLTILDNTIKNRLLKGYIHKSEYSEEYNYSSAYGELYFKCLEIGLEKIQQRKAFIETKRDYIVTLHQNNIKLIDITFDVFKSLILYTIPINHEPENLIKFKSELLSFISSQVKEFSELVENLKLEENTHKDIHKTLFKFLYEKE